MPCQTDCDNPPIRLATTFHPDRSRRSTRLAPGFRPRDHPHPTAEATVCLRPSWVPVRLSLLPPVSLAIVRDEIPPLFVADHSASLQTADGCDFRPRQTTTFHPATTARREV